MAGTIDTNNRLSPVREEWYKEAYEGVESLQNFSSREELEVYRDHLLEKSKSQVEFILKNTETPVRLLEIGTGNGRIPVALAGLNVLGYALGFDISASRIEFARSWAVDRGINSVDFEVRDALEFSPLPADFDLALCITGTFGYFAASSKGMDRSVLNYIADSLVDGGRLILELYTLPLFVGWCLESPDRTYRFWQHLPPEDPFSFYLHEFTYYEERSVLEVHKIFIRRQDGWVDDGRREYLKIYRDEEIVGMLESCGLEVCSIESCFSGDDEPDVLHGKRVIVARKDRGRICH